MSNLSGNAEHEVECLLPTGLAVVLEADCDNGASTSAPGQGDDTDSAGTREGPGTGVFAAFLEANLGCYWNPHLEESLRGLRYGGWLWPGTLLMTGRHIHLDTVRSAWGRRVLRAPRGYRLQRVGELRPLEVTVTPQTQFTPLPEALCVIVAGLNRRSTPANVDSVQKELCQLYHDVQPPPERMVYEVLDVLIGERKLLHTASGYVIMTPEMLTVGCPVDHKSSPPTPSTVFVPVMSPAVAEACSISCQTDDPHMEASSAEPSTPTKSKEERRKNRLERSHSMKGKRRDQEAFTRTSSFRASHENDKTVVLDISKKGDSLERDGRDKGGEKKSMLKKLFGRRSKPVTYPTEEPQPQDSAVVEYATFSAQFPPPDLHTFEEQLQAFLMQSPPIENSLGQPRATHSPAQQSPSPRYTHEVALAAARERGTSPAYSPAGVDEQSYPQRNQNTTRLRSGNTNRHSVYQETHFNAHEDCDDSNIYWEPDSLRQSDTMATPQSKGYSNPLHGNDISVQYYGRMPRKGAFMSMSRDSGVNCIGLEPSSSRLQARSRSSGKRSHSTGRAAQKPLPTRGSSPVKHQAVVHQPPGGSAALQDSGFSSPRTDGDYGQFRIANDAVSPPGKQNSKPPAGSSGKKGKLKARLASRESIYITGSDFYPPMALAADDMLLEAAACVGASGESPQVGLTCGSASPGGASSPHPSWNAPAAGPDPTAASSSMRDPGSHAAEISPQHRKTTTSRERPPSKGTRRREKEPSKRHSMYLDNGYGLRHERNVRDAHAQNRHLRKSKDSDSRLSFLDDCQVVGVV